MAINLRKTGRSYREIVNQLNVSKSTLSYWLRDVKLTKEQNEALNHRLKYKSDRGRLRTSIALQARRVFRENTVSHQAEKEFNVFIKDPFFQVGLTMYWCEGAKKNNYFSFINSDPNMVIMMEKWIKKYIISEPIVLKYRLYIHLPYKDENCEEYWAKILGISVNDLQKTIYKPTPHTVKKNPSYKGCLRITILKIDILRKVMAWQKLLVKYYDNV